MSMLFLLRENVWVTVFEFLQPLFLVQIRGSYLPQEKYWHFCHSYQILLTQHVHIH